MKPAICPSTSLWKMTLPTTFTARDRLCVRLVVHNALGLKRPLSGVLIVLDNPDNPVGDGGGRVCHKGDVVPDLKRLRIHLLGNHQRPLGGSPPAWNRIIQPCR